MRTLLKNMKTNKHLIRITLSFFIVSILSMTWYLMKSDNPPSKQGISARISVEKKQTKEKQVRVALAKPKEQVVQQKQLENAEIIEDIPEKEGVVTKPPTVAPTTTEPFVIVIDPGHQAKANLEQEPIGPGSNQTKYKVTGGTRGSVTKKPEFVLTLEASNLLKSHLEKRGYKVVLTRTSHEVNISNSERADIANQLGADLFIRIHADGSENPQTSGFSVLVPAKENSYTAPIFEDSNMAAQMVINTISKEVNLHQKGLFYRNDMSGFNWSKVPVILPEIGFMTNPEEDQKLSDSGYLTRIMELLAIGVEEYANYKKEQMLK